MPVGGAVAPLTTIAAFVDCPYGADVRDRMNVVVEVDLAISTGTASDVDGANRLASAGAKLAVSECAPAPSVTFTLAVPSVTADEPTGVCPSRNVTVPAASAGATVAVSVSS